MWLGVPLGVAFAAGAVYFVLMFASATSPTPLTHDSARKRLLGTDGAYLYVKDSQAGNERVPVRGGKVTPLAAGGSGSGPALSLANVSPDGSKLLLVQKSRTGAGGPLWARPVGGGPPVRLGDIEGSSGAWSPGGRKLVYINGTTLYVARADGSGSRKLADLPGPFPGKGKPRTPPAWSPDGKEIALNLVSPASGFVRLWQISANGRNLREMFSGKTWACCGRWSADGQYFIFVSWGTLYEARVRLGPMRLSTRMPIELTYGESAYLDPVPGKAGRKLYAVHAFQSGELERYDAATQSFKPYLGGIPATQVAFSRDGEWVAYITYPAHSLWRSRRDGSDKLQLTQPPLYARSPQWSPDGKEIVFQGQKGKDWYSGTPRIYEVAASGGTPHELIPKGLGDQGDPFWSPEGAWLAFAATANGSKPAIRMWNSQTHRVVPMLYAQGMYDPRWSPNGRYIVTISAAFKYHIKPGPDFLYSKLSRGGLKVYDFKAHRGQNLVKGYIGYPCWSHDSRYVYFLSFDGSTEVDRVDVAKMIIERVASLNDPGFNQAIVYLHDQGINVEGDVGYWLGLTPDDAPLVVRNVAREEVVSMNWHEP